MEKNQMKSVMEPDSRFPHFEKQLDYLWDHPGVLIFRHAERDLITDSMNHKDVLALSLTEKGRADAEALGRLLREQKPDWRVPVALTSPIQRARDTLALICKGAAIQVTPKVDALLVLKGLMTEDVTMRIIESKMALMDEVAAGRMEIGPVPVKTAAENIAGFIIKELETALQNEAFPSSSPTLGLCACHDATLCLLLMRYFGDTVVTGEAWPGLLETMLLQQLHAHQYRLVWRGRVAHFSIST